MARKADGGMFVPEAEQPYKIPCNWQWVRLGGITDIVGGGTPSTKEKAYYDNGDIPWISPADLSGYADIYIAHGAKSITRLGLEKSSAQLLPAETVCLSTRAPIGYVAIAKNPLSTNQGFKSFLPSPSYLPRYLYWYLKGNKDLLESRANGTTFLELSGRKAANIEFPLPPLAEQQRIVERIESLFTKLDAARENAQAVVDGFELRKAAILHRAFSGKLTKEWRKSNQISDSTWQTVELQSVCQSIFDGDHLPPPKSDAGIPFLVISNVNNGHLSFENTRFVPQEYYDALTDTRKPEIGDVLYTLVGSYGIPVVVDDARPFCFQRHMALIKPDRIDTYYLWYQLQGIDAYNQASEIATGSAQLTVPIKGLRKMKIALASQKEQRKIAKELAYLLEKDQQAKDTAQQIILRIDAMKKAILGRAFRGELGTNDPSEESPETLLRDLL